MNTQTEYEKALNEILKDFKVWSHRVMNGKQIDTQIQPQQAIAAIIDATESQNRVIEIDLLRDVALGVESELTPDYEKGGRAAIGALRSMADVLEARHRESHPAPTKIVPGGE